MSTAAHNLVETRKSLVRWVIELDRILRGDTTCQRELFRDCSKTADIRFPVGGISVVLGALGGCFGICMAVFAVVRGCETGEYAHACFQVFANLAKVPLLFGLTIFVTFPSLYVFNALVGSRLKLLALFRLLLASLAVNLAVLASLGPIVAFFSLQLSELFIHCVVKRFCFCHCRIPWPGFPCANIAAIKRADHRRTCASRSSNGDLLSRILFDR